MTSQKKCVVGICVTAICTLAVLIIMAARANQSFTLLEGWFDGGSNISLKGIEFDDSPGSLLILDDPLLDAIDQAIKAKHFASGPQGYQRNAILVLNGRRCAEALFSTGKDDESIIIGIPTEAGPGIAEFRYAEIRIGVSNANVLRGLIAK